MHCNVSLRVIHCSNIMSMQPSYKRLFIALGILFGVTVCFSGGYVVGRAQISLFSEASQFSSAWIEPQTSEAITPEQYVLFWKVWQAVKKDYVNQPVDDTALFYGAISGIAAAVNDPYTVFLDPKEADLFATSISGKFQGIGAEIGMKDRQIVVVAPLKGSPAEQAGIRSGDTIIKIDGKDTLSLTVDAAVSLIRGTKDTSVTLTIYRSGAEAVQDIIIKRAEITIPSVVYTNKEVSGKHIAIIELSHFDEGSQAEFTKVAQQVLLDQPDGIVLDLRNNPGGLLDQCVGITSMFIDQGVIVKEHLSDGKEQSLNSDGSGTLISIPKLTVLINEGSASAAEILAGALQDYKKATIIGTQSFGKGSVQNFQQFPDGSILKVTMAKWLTPLGSTIDHTGITPDIEVKLTAEDVTAKRDPQLDRAIEEIIK